MAGMQWVLDLALMLLLAATLFHAVRLERALGVLRRDRAALEALVDGFNASTREAQSGIERLRGAADGAGGALARQTEAAILLRDDLTFLIERGERLADRLDQMVRAGRALSPEPQRPMPPVGWDPDAARDTTRPYAPAASLSAAPLPAAPPPAAAPGPEAGPLRVRSRAERDLLAALRMAR